METLPAWFVVVMGMSTVFVGLFLIILFCKLLSFAFVKKTDKADPKEKKKETADGIPPEKREILRAAAAVAIAEDCGKDPAGIRIKSFKQVK